MQQQALINLWFERPTVFKNWPTIPKGWVKQYLLAGVFFAHIPFLIVCLSYFVASIRTVHLAQKATKQVNIISFACLLMAISRLSRCQYSCPLFPQQRT